MWSSMPVMLVLVLEDSLRTKMQSLSLSLALKVKSLLTSLQHALKRSVIVIIIIMMMIITVCYCQYSQQ